MAKKTGLPSQQYKYDAFISYRHLDPDKTVAVKLQKLLETYRIPRTISKVSGIKKINRVFRDQEELPTSADLGADIERALQESRFLIIVCSPNTPKSVWCRREIELFKKMHEIEKVLTLLVDGEPDESFPIEVRFDDIKGKKVEREPLAADVRASGISKMFRKLKVEKLRLLAPMLGVGFDALRQRHRERRIKIVASMCLAAALALTIFGGFALYQSEQIAQANKALQIQISRTEEQKEIAEQNEAEAVRQRDTVLVSQSKTLADQSMELLKDGDPIKAALLAQYALPEDLDNPDRPLVAEAEEALRSIALDDNYDTYRPFTVLDCMTDGREIFPSITISPDGKLMAVFNSYILSTQVYDIESANLMYTLKGYVSASIWKDPSDFFLPYKYGIAFSSDSKYLYVPFSDGQVYVVDALTGTRNSALENDTAAKERLFDIPEYDVSYDYASEKDNYKKTISRDGDKLFEIDSGALTDEWALSPGDRFMFYADWFSGRVYDMETGKEMFRLPDFTNKRRFEESLTFFSPDGKYLLAAHEKSEDSFHNYVMRVFEISSGQLVLEHEIQMPNGASPLVSGFGATVYYSIPRFSPDGKYICCPTEDNNEVLYDLTTGQRVYVLSGHNALVSSVDFDETGQRIVTASSDGTVVIWNTSDGKPLETINMPTGYTPVSAQFAGEGNLAVLRYNETQGDYSIQIYEKISERRSMLLPRSNDSSDSCEVYFFPSDGRVLLNKYGPGARGIASVFDHVEGDKLFDLEGIDETNNYWNFAISPDGTRIVGNNSFESAWWDGTNGKLMKKANLKDCINIERALQIRDPVFSEDGSKVAGWLGMLETNYGGIVVWDLDKDTFKMIECGDGEAFYKNFSISDDFSKALYSYNGLSKMFDLSTGDLLYELPAKAVMSADGNYIISFDKQLSILDASDGSKSIALEESSYNACFSPDSKALLVYTTDGYLKQFDTASGSLILSRYYPQLFSQKPLNFSGDGSVIAGSSMLLDAKTGDILVSLNNSPETATYIFMAISADGSQMAVTTMIDCIDGHKSQVKIYTIPKMSELLKNIDALTNGMELTDDEKRRFNLE